MNVLEKRVVRFVISIISIWMLTLCESDYLGISSQKTISIYYRYPFFVLVLGLIWLLGLLMNKKILELPSYIILYGLLLYRLLFEMERFIPFNFSHYTTFDYMAYSIATSLFVINMVMNILAMIQQTTNH